MKQIGFVQPKPERPRNRSVERMAVLPELPSNLTLHERRNMVERYLGSPRLRVLQGGPPQICDDDLSVRRTYTPFSRSTRHDILIARREGALIFERYLLWDCTHTPAFDSDDFLRQLIQFSVRAVNGIALLSGARSLRIVASMEGLEGSQLIFNPRRELSRTFCRSGAQRTERFEFSGAVDLGGLLRSALCRVANEVLNAFQSANGRYCECIYEDEFAELFDAELARVTLCDGPLSGVTGRPVFTGDQLGMVTASTAGEFALR